MIAACSPRKASNDALCDEYADLKMGLVDGVVIGVAERLEATAIATFDLRHFGAVAIEGNPRLYPRDLGGGPLSRRS